MRSWHVGVAQWSLIVHFYLSIYFFCASVKAPYVILPGYMSVSKEVMPKLLGAGLGRDRPPWKSSCYTPLAPFFSFFLFFTLPRTTCPVFSPFNSLRILFDKFLHFKPFQDYHIPINFIYLSLYNLKQ